MRSHNFDFAKNFFHLSILAGDFQRVDLLFGSNTGDGISQLGGNLLTDPDKYYKVLIIMNTARNTEKYCEILRKYSEILRNTQFLGRQTWNGGKDSTVILLSSCPSNVN